MSLNKPVTEIREKDLQELIDNKVAEKKTIDYKLKLPANSDSEKREFLRDVSSFANSAGGHLIYGMVESAGTPTAFSGLTGNSDQEILRLENILRDGIEPRIPGIQTAAVSLPGAAFAVVISIPRSWALPHRVNFLKDMNFYTRNSAGKYPLDVPELRSLFLLSESIADRIRNFRIERLLKIENGQTPVPLVKAPTTVLHILPFVSFGGNKEIIGKYDQFTNLPPIARMGYSPLYNFDGFVNYCEREGEGFARSYVQLFRNGGIEAVVAGFPGINEGRLILNLAVEEELIQYTRTYLLAQESFGMEPPLGVMLSMVGVKGFRFSNVSAWAFSREGSPIDSAVLVFPDVTVESFDVNVEDVLKPVFDMLWNAAGYAKSLSYDDHGKRKK